MTGVPSVHRLARASATLSSQALSSLTNFSVGALALSASGENLAAFGRFAIGLQLCQVIIAVAQSSTGSSLLVHGARPPVEGVGSGDVRAGAAAASLVVGVLAAIPVAVVGALVGGQQGQILLLVAAGAPFLAAQYTLREDRFARMEPLAALRADAAWFAVLVAAALLDRFTDWQAGVKDYLAAWLLGAALSSLPLVRVGLRSGFGHLGTFWTPTERQATKLGTEALLARSVLVVALVATDRVVGSAASGSLAAAVLVLSPMSVVHASAGALVVPGEVRRRGIHIPGWRLPMKVFGAITAVTLVWAAALWAFNSMERAFGPFDLTANGVTGWLFLAMLARFVGMGFWRGPGVALRVADAADESLRARLVGVALQWTLPVVGLYASGLVGGAVGLAVATWTGGLMAWYYLLRLPAKVARAG